MARELIRTITDNRKNLLINGNFDFWQRGTSFLAAGANVYTADRWKNQLAGADITRQDVSADVSGAQYGIRYVASSEEILLEQRIENEMVRDLAGKQVTLSFKARATVGTPSLVLDVYSADSANTWTTSTLVLGGQALGSPTASFETFEYTFTVTPTMASNGFNIILKTPSTVTATVDFAQVQLIEGGTGPFRLAGRNYAEEFQLCQRYLYQPHAFNVPYIQHIAHGRNVSTTQGNLSLEFPVVMFKVPTLLTGGTISDFKAHNGTGSTDLDISSLTVSNASTLRGNVNLLTAGSLNAGGAATMRLLGNSDAFLRFDAELI